MRGHDIVRHCAQCRQALAPVLSWSRTSIGSGLLRLEGTVGRTAYCQTRDSHYSKRVRLLILQCRECSSVDGSQEHVEFASDSTPQIRGRNIRQVPMWTHHLLYANQAQLRSALIHLPTLKYAHVPQDFSRITDHDSERPTRIAAPNTSIYTLTR